MTDREMLELAAKAIGLELRYNSLGEQDANYAWNPLTDDRDAFRLAVTLGDKYPAMVIGIFNRGAFPHTSASVVHRGGAETYVEQDAGDDIAAATRRAIVRAAAAIGSAM